MTSAPSFLAASSSAMAMAAPRAPLLRPISAEATIPRPLVAAAATELFLLTIRFVAKLVLPFLLKLAALGMKQAAVAIRPFRRVTTVVAKAVAFRSLRICSHPVRLVIRRCMKLSRALPLAPCGRLLLRTLRMSMLICSRSLESAGHSAHTAVSTLPLVLPALAAIQEFRRPGSLCHCSVAHGVQGVARRLRLWLSSARRLHLYSAVGIASIGLTALRHSEGLVRSFTFNKKMVPMACEYHFYDWLLRHDSAAERSAVFQKLHTRHAPEVLAVIYELRGFYIKIGQVVSSFGDTFVPAAFVDALHVLQDAVPPQPAPYVRELLERELGAPIEDIFISFDLDAPLGAASIGQVHAATMPNGLEVVVKLQYPDAKRFFRNDIRCLKTFCRVFAPENVELMDEIEKQFVTEFDYRLEARLLRQAATNLLPHFPQLAIPLPLDEDHPSSSVQAPGGAVAPLCTERCLVMERLKGTSLLSAQREALDRLAQSRNTTSEQLRREFEMQFKAGQLTKSLVPSSFLMELYEQVHRASFALRNAAYALINKPTIKPRPRINPPKLIRLLFDIHGHQLLHDGFFNGDPHPGNIMLLDDGRIGLIDWGQVKQISKDVRLKVARLVIALADRDQVATADCWEACGFQTQHMDRWCLDKWATWRFSRMTPDVTNVFDSIVYFEKRLGNLDPIVVEPQEYVMAFRLAALLRGSAMGLGDVTIDSAQHWRKQAVRLLHEEGEQLPVTIRGRRLPSSEFLYATEEMRTFKQRRVTAL